MAVTAAAATTAGMARPLVTVEMVAPVAVVHRMLDTQPQVVEAQQHQHPVLGLHMETTARAEVVAQAARAAVREPPVQEALVVLAAHFLVQLLQLVDQVAAAQIHLWREQEMVEVSIQRAEREAREL